MKIAVLMKINSEKKHSIRYDAVLTGQPEPAITSVYVMKSSLSAPYPQKINLTVEME